MGNEAALLPADKCNRFLKGASIILSVRRQACQKIQDNKFAICLQYLRENGNIEVGFLLANKHQRFLQIDTIILVVARPPQVIQNNKFAISLQYLQKVSCKLIL